MRKITTTCLVVLTVHFSMAQSTVPRIPVYEIFSSSTCPPCKPANDYLSPLFEDFEGELAIVKYQMNWPGAGDPYYTSEGASRRSFYAVSGVPAVFRNSIETAYGSFSTSAINSDLALETSMKMELRYMIDSAAQTVRIRARVEALADYNDGAHRLFIPIVEKLTTKNKETNGETEFHNVFKKMLPEAQGEIIIGSIEQGTVYEYDTTYTFQGDYRLPANSSDLIDNDIEHSVEEFNDLHVIMFMQSLSDKEIYQGAIGVREYDVENLEREWGSDPLPPAGMTSMDIEDELKFFPNPASEEVVLDFGREMNVLSMGLYNVAGALVLSGNTGTYSSSTLDIRSLRPGCYMLDLQTDQMRVTRILIVEH